MNATLHDPETDELLAEIEYWPAAHALIDVSAWQGSFTVIEEHAHLETGIVTIKLEDGRVGPAIIESLVFRSYQLRRTGTLVGSGPLE